MFTHHQPTRPYALSSWRSPFRSPPPRDGGGRRVLVVTEHREQARALGGLLWMGGLEVLGAPDVATAFLLVDHLLPDAVVVDAHLPAHELRALAILLRRRRQAPPPIIGMSACNRVDPAILARAGLSACCTALPEAGVIAATVERLVGERQAPPAPNGLTSALLAAVGAHSPETASHMRRVATIAVGLGERLGLGEEALSELASGALLHDIGKLCVPRSVLHKPGPLTATEQAAIRRHPSAGAHILAPAQVAPTVLAVAQGHHERFDGTGYPAARRGASTPLAARIVSVADAYDAMTTPRPYRVAIGQAGALSRLAAGAGSYWDPEIVDAMFDLLAGRRAGAGRQIA